jgi:hypothetical protein
MAWRHAHLPAVDLERASDELQAQHVAPPGGDDLAAYFRRLGYSGGFPQNLNYSLLTYYGMGEFQGQQVPQLIFMAPQGGIHARVRLLSPGQFSLDDLPSGLHSPEGYPFRLEVWRDTDGCAEVVDYTGASATWIRRAIDETTS